MYTIPPTALSMSCPGSHPQLNPTVLALTKASVSVLLQWNPGASAHLISMSYMRERPWDSRMREIEPLALKFLVH